MGADATEPGVAGGPAFAPNDLILLRGGYPPLAVRPTDRKTYLDALKRGSLAADLRPFQLFMHECLDATLDDYRRALREGLPPT